MNIRIGLSLITFLLLCLCSSLTLQDDARESSRAYMVTCASSECQQAISYCNNQTKCLGDICKRCLEGFTQCNSQCTKDLFNETEYLQVNGMKYLPCDDTSVAQARGCELICRSKFFLNSYCSLLNCLPVCICTSVNASQISSTTSSSEIDCQHTGHSEVSTSSSTTSSSTTQSTTPLLNEVTLSGFTSDINGIAVLNNGNLAVASGFAIQVWDLATAQLKRRFDGYSDTFSTIIELPNDVLAASAINNNVIVQWDYPSGVILRVSSFSPRVDNFHLINNTYLICTRDSSSSPSILVLNATTLATIRTISLSASNQGLRVLQSGIMASIQLMNRINVWSIFSTSAQATFTSTSDILRTIEFLDNGDIITMYERGLTYAFQIWDQSGTLKRNIATNQTSGLTLFRLLPSGELASVSNNTIRIWNYSSATLLKTITHTHTILSMIVINEGRQLVSRHSGDRVVKVWNV
jgi:hypothetical protein